METRLLPCYLLTGIRTCRDGANLLYRSRIRPSSYCAVQVHKAQLSATRLAWSARAAGGKGDYCMQLGMRLDKTAARQPGLPPKEGAVEGTYVKE